MHNRLKLALAVALALVALGAFTLGRKSAPEKKMTLEEFYGLTEPANARARRAEAEAEAWAAKWRAAQQEQAQQTFQAEQTLRAQEQFYTEAVYELQRQRFR